MNDMACSLCKWSALRVTDDQGPVLDCRRNPPQVVVHGDLLIVWPQVEFGDWCGEFKYDAIKDPVA